MNPFEKLAYELYISGLWEKVAKPTEAQLKQMLSNPNLPAAHRAEIQNRLNNLDLGKRTAQNVQAKQQAHRVRVQNQAQMPGFLRRNLTQAGRDAAASVEATGAALDRQRKQLNTEGKQLKAERGHATNVRQHNRVMQTPAQPNLQARLDHYKNTGQTMSGRTPQGPAPKPGFFGNMLKRFPGGGRGALIAGGLGLGAIGAGYAMSGDKKPPPPQNWYGGY